MRIHTLLAAALAAAPVAAHAAVPHFDHVTIVVMENRNYSSVVGSTSAPYFNGTLIPQGALLRNAAAVSHPSEPNYLALFSGSTHAIPDDRCPLSFATPNLASELAAAGDTFAGYSESMPRDGYDRCSGSGGLYARKHVPWVNFVNVPAGENLVYAGLPANPPSVMWITPNMCNDMHDCSTRTGDAWLAKNLPPIVAWNAAHRGLLIVTWDEADPDTDGANHIPTVLVGPMVRPGSTTAARIDDYTLLRAIENDFGLACIANECGAKPISDIWQ